MMVKRMIGMMAVLALVLPAAAQETTRAGRAHDTVVTVLKLTADQVTKWDALRATRRAAIKPLEENLHDVQAQLTTVLATDDPDPAAVGRLVIQARDLRTQVTAANRDYIDGFQALLDEQQVKKLKFLRAAAKAERVLPAFRLFGLVGQNTTLVPGARTN